MKKVITLILVLLIGFLKISFSQIVEIAPTSIEAHSDKGIKMTVYPNPAQNMLFIKNGTGLPIEKVEITNLMSQEILKISEFKTEIDISTLTYGVYFLNCNVGGTVYRTKFVKN